MATYGEEGVGNVAWSYPRKIERCESFAVRTTCKVYLIYHEEIRVFQAWNISADIKAAVVQKSCPQKVSWFQKESLPLNRFSSSCWSRFSREDQENGPRFFVSSQKGIKGIRFREYFSGYGDGEEM